MENFFLVLIYLLVGTQLRRVRQFPAETGIVLNQYVLYVALPALVLQKMPLLEFSAQLWMPAVLPWVLLAITVGAVLLAGRLWNWERGVIGALLVILPLGNTSFLGFPMVEAFYGDTGLPFAIIYDQAGSFLALATYSTVLAAWFSPVANKPTGRQMMAKVLLFPAFVAMLLGLALKGWSYPPFLDLLLDSMASTLVPVVMIAVGFQFRLQLDGGQVAPLAFALLFKLILMPMMALGALWLLQPPPLLMQVSVFEAAMPPMVSAGALAIGAALAPRFVATLIGMGLFCSFLSLPLWYWLLESLL
ncbi:AEC family transporter [Lacimicrobium alkaliphilum]|uniref:Membrane protein n=1 Tax=Lacimicrobium alkaliphilum TaxID=1526571 RepID=A0ABQ1QYR9_9ALTE|nr:AEC family transporter [Lacimicrobium alkaliphilum]GGD50284.1 membrane protein [Lacimicrobium alkaliphilum]